MSSESDEPIHLLLSQLISMLKSVDEKITRHIDGEVAAFEKFAAQAFIDGNPHAHKLTHIAKEREEQDNRKDRRSLRLKIAEVGIIATLVFIATASWKEAVRGLVNLTKTL